jgi:hypothetical protein
MKITHEARLATIRKTLLEAIREEETTLAQTAAE